MDAWIQWTYRGLTLAALGAFVGFLATVHPLWILLSAGFGVAAYVSIRVYVRRNPVEVGVGVGSDAEDRVRAGSEEEVAPGVSAAGIHLSIESRSRWRPKR